MTKSKTALYPSLSILFVTFLTGVSLVVSACASKSHSEGDVAATSSEVNPLIPLSWGPNYKYNELLTKDYDEMFAMVQGMVKKAHHATGSGAKGDGRTGGDGEAVEHLGRALKLIYSRPDSDNMVTKLVGEVRRDLQGLNSYEDAIAGLVNEAIRVAKNTEGSIIGQSTALVELENIMADIRPEVQNGNAGLRRVVQTVRDADLSMSDEVKRDRRLRGMFKTKNPSEEARDLLRAIDKDKADKEKKKKK